VRGEGLIAALDVWRDLTSLLVASAQDGQMHGAAGAQAKACRSVEPHGPVIALVSREFEPGRLAVYEIEGVSQNSAAQPASTSCRCQTEINNLPGVAFRKVGQ
jgi:hypothetical protein